MKYPVSLHFTYLPGFAAYIKKNQLQALVKEQLRIAREIEIPLLKYLSHLSEDELMQLLIETSTELLTFLEVNNAKGHIDLSLGRWLKNQLPQLEVGHIVPEDITLVNHMRKRAFQNFLPSYVQDQDIILKIINEIDQYSVAIQTGSFKIYTSIVNQRLSDEVNFSEKINDTLPGILYVFDLATRSIVFCNRKVTDLLGYSIQEIKDMGEHFVETVEYPSERNMVKEHFQKIYTLKDGEIATLRHRMKHKDGHYNWMSNYETIFKRDMEGNPQQIIGIILDIDELQNTSEKLTKSEEQLLRAQELSQVGSFEWNLETGDGTTTPQLLKILNLRDKTELNQYAEHIHPEDKERVQKITSNATKELGLYDYECRYIAGPSEKLIWAKGSVGITDGALTVKGTIMDVTEKYQLIEKLQQNEKLFIEAQAITHIGNWAWDMEQDKVTWSDELYRIYEIEPQSEEITFEKYAAFIHSDDRGSRLRILDNAIKSGSASEYFFRIITRKNNLRILHGKSQVKMDGKGKPIKLVGTCQDVTEKQLLIERLQQSEILYKQAQVISNIGNWSYDFSKKEIRWSDQMFIIYGMEVEDRAIQYDELFKYNHPEDMQMVIAEMQKSVEKGSHDIFYRIILQDNSEKIIHTKGQTQYDEEGNAIGMVGTAQDVSRQKMIENELRENQNFIHKITDATPSVISTYNVKNGIYRFVSKGLIKLLGYESDALLNGGNKFFRTLLHPDDVEVVRRKNKEALNLWNEKKEENDGISEFQYRVLHKNGCYRWMHTYGNVFDRDQDGNVLNVLNISLDITDNLDKEKRLIEQEHFIKHIAEASPTILYLFDLTERIFIYVNKEVKEVLGYEPEEIIALGGKVSEQFLFGEDDIKSRENYTRYNNTAGSATMHQFEVTLKHRNGKLIWMLTREIVFKRNEQGRPLQVLGSALDITLRKEIEQALIYKTHQLEQSNASLEEFAHVASHDLQEPLRKISTFGDRLLTSHKQQLSAEGALYLEKIIQSSIRMQQLINDILSISVISGDKQFGWYDLNTLVAEVLQTLEYKIEQTKAVITFDHLPRANVNASQMRQLFQNLLSNSIKFSRKNVQPNITVSHEYVDELQHTKMQVLNASRYMKLTFKDNGIGFENMFADKIFNIFQRLVGHRDYEGTGIGLSICKKIVENHGGNISARGVPDEGAEFIIILPV